MIRIGVVAAVLTVLLGGTVFGWNFFRAVADWTEETFRFLTGQAENNEELGVFHSLRLSVQSKTETPAVPNWAPSDTVENGLPKKTERTDRFSVFASYTVENREFTVLITIHDTPPKVYTITYQKNAEIEEEYLAGGITHYIMGNTETLSAMWINGNVEGCLQGELTLEELRQMIDSIYEE